MQTITINLNNETIAEKVFWLLKHFENEGLEIIAKEDLEDLKFLKATRNEKSISFDDYLKNEN